MKTTVKSFSLFQLRASVIGVLILMSLGIFSFDKSSIFFIAGFIIFVIIDVLVLAFPNKKLLS